MIRILSEVYKITRTKFPNPRLFNTVFQSFKCYRTMVDDVVFNSSADSNIVAVCQMTSTNNKTSNLAIVKTLVQTAKQQSAVMVFLPEGCDFISENMDENFDLAEDLTGTLVTEYCRLAKQHDIWISIGGFHERVSELESERKIYNTHLIIDNNGDIKAKYRKLHLFDVNLIKENIHLTESTAVKPGSHLIEPIVTPIGILGLAICYDLRFPEMSTILRKLGANVLTYPSAFTHKTGTLHWEPLLKARAIENQCYVIAAAQVGYHNEKRLSHGHSMIIDPLGQIVGECPAYCDCVMKPQVITAQINSNMITSIQNEMKIFKQRRKDIYNLTCVKNPKYSKFKEYKFSDKTIPSDTIFYESNLSYAFTNIRCVVPGHVLVTTKRITKKLTDLDDEETSDLFQTVTKVQNVVEKLYNTNSSTIVVQDGVDAGQTVPHTHVHILPRKPNDFARNDDIYDILAKHDREDSEIKLRSLDEMVTEATTLKSMFIRL